MNQHDPMSGAGRDRREGDTRSKGKSEGEPATRLSFSEGLAFRHRTADSMKRRRKILGEDKKRKREACQQY